MAISFLSTSYRTRGNKSISFSFLLLFKRYIPLDSDKVMGDHAALNSEGVCLLSRCSSLSLFIKISLYVRYLFLTLILDKLMIRLLKVKHINEMKKTNFTCLEKSQFKGSFYVILLLLHSLVAYFPQLWKVKHDKNQ